MNIQVADPLVVDDETLDAAAVREELNRLLGSRSTLTQWDIGLAKTLLIPHVRQGYAREKEKTGAAREVKSEGKEAKEADSNKGKGKGKKGKKGGKRTG